jgi:hypothetical protein
MNSLNRVILPSISLFFAAVSASFSANAQAEIYRCEREGGIVEYTNIAGTSGKQCRKVDTPIATVIPAPKLPAAAAAPSASRNPAGQAAAATNSGGFPKVDDSTQRSRDSDRRRILDDELGKEQQKLASLKKDYNGGEPERRGDERNYEKYQDRVKKLKDDIGRSESNVESLKRELNGIKG